MRWRIGRQHEIAELEASDDIARVYHESREILRLSGVDGILRPLATHRGLLPALWNAVRANLETRDFESAADLLRAEAVRAASRLGVRRSRVPLGESQRVRLESLLALHHYARPKILLLAAMLRLALHHHRVGRATSLGEHPTRLERGVPADMPPMECASNHSLHAATEACLRRIRSTLELPVAPDENRGLALWPDYLTGAWERLTDAMMSDDYVRSARGLRRLARRLAASLPFGVPFPIERVHALGADPVRVDELIRTWEGVLPVLTLNVAALAIDGPAHDTFTQSPSMLRAMRSLLRRGAAKRIAPAVLEGLLAMARRCGASLPHAQRGGDRTGWNARADAVAITSGHADDGGLGRAGLASANRFR